MITGTSTSEITGNNTDEIAEDYSVQAKVDKYIQEMLSIKVHAEEIPAEEVAVEEIASEQDHTEQVLTEDQVSKEDHKQGFHTTEFRAVKFNSVDFHAEEVPAEEVPAEISGQNIPELTKNYLVESPGKMHAEDFIHKPVPVYPTDRGFYIWYKESVPSIIDTSIVSDEYELLYQSVKRNEYKSKLNVYVATYSVCLAVVIMLFITFRFIVVPYNEHKAEIVAADYEISKPLVVKPSDRINILGENPYFNMNPFITIIQDKPLYAEVEPQGIKPEINQPEVRSLDVKQPEGSSNSETVEGMPRNSLGFTDMKNNVIYVVLPNGKYSIQESSWNNEDKAVTRINKLNSLGIKNTNGAPVKAQFEKADLVDKGVWYRTRVGEFSSLQEAKQTAEQMRSEEKTKNIAGLFIFPGSNLKV